MLRCKSLARSKFGTKKKVEISSSRSILNWYDTLCIFQKPQVTQKILFFLYQSYHHNWWSLGKQKSFLALFFNWIWPILAVQVAQNLHATISFSDDDLEGWLDASLTSTAKCQPLCKWVWQEDTIYLKKYVAVRIALIWCNFTTRKKEKKAKGDRSTLGLMANEVKEATPDQIGWKCLRIIESIS